MLQTHLLSSQLKTVDILFETEIPDTFFKKYKSFVTLYMFAIFEQSLVSHCSHITLFYLFI